MTPNSVLRAFFAMAIPVAAWAQAGLPTGASVVAGSATIAATANSMTVTTGSQRTIINYSGFNVGAGNSVRFDQPSSGSATLNRVLGNDVSSIRGSVMSNGQIFLVNPNGIFVGPSGSFSGSSVYLSTGNISNADFLCGNIRFEPPPTGSTIRIEGIIDAADVIQVDTGSLELTGLLNSPSGTITINGSGTGGNLSLPGGSGNISSGGSGNILSGGSGNILLTPPVVVAGSASFASGSGGLTVTNTNGAIIDWSRFNIGANQSVNFMQPGAGSVVLNRVTGDPALIIGKLTSNGKVFLINPAGVLASPSKVVSVGSTKLALASVQTPNLVAAPPPAIARPVAPSLPRGTSGLVNGTVTVRLSLVDAAPITLR